MKQGIHLAAIKVKEERTEHLALLISIPQVPDWILVSDTGHNY